MDRSGRDDKETSVADDQPTSEAQQRLEDAPRPPAHAARAQPEELVRRAARCARAQVERQVEVVGLPPGPHDPTGAPIAPPQEALPQRKTLPGGPWVDPAASGSDGGAASAARHRAVLREQSGGDGGRHGGGIVRVG